MFYSHLFMSFSKYSFLSYWCYAVVDSSSEFCLRICFFTCRNIKPGRPESIKHAPEICNLFFFIGCNSSCDIQPLLVQMFLLTVIAVFSLMKQVFEVICARVGFCIWKFLGAGFWVSCSHRSSSCSFPVTQNGLRRVGVVMYSVKCLLFFT